MRDAAYGAIMFLVVVLFVRLAIAGHLGAAINVLLSPGPSKTPAAQLPTN